VPAHGAHDEEVADHPRLDEESVDERKARRRLGSLLRFFPSADDVPDIGGLRKTGLAAIDRSTGSIDQETAALVDQVITTLRWEVSQTAAAVDRIRSRLGI
jgi:hypothetical protein